jgi:uncharacterized protein YcfJ
VGASVGTSVGASVGAVVGASVGELVGADVLQGLGVHDKAEFIVPPAEAQFFSFCFKHTPVKQQVIKPDGASLGALVSSLGALGASLGASLGALVSSLGASLGAVVTVGLEVGAVVGV